jgi:hypothetical protein
MTFVSCMMDLTKHDQVYKKKLELKSPGLRAWPGLSNSQARPLTRAWLGLAFQGLAWLSLGPSGQACTSLVRLRHEL